MLPAESLYIPKPTDRMSLGSSSSVYSFGFLGSAVSGMGCFIGSPAFVSGGFSGGVTFSFSASGAASFFMMWYIGKGLLDLIHASSTKNWTAILADRLSIGMTSESVFR